MQLVEQFLVALAAAWDRPARPTLRILGSTALFLRTDYARGTRDSDVLSTAELEPPIQERLLEIAGPSSKLARRFHLHLQILPNGIPFLPRAPRWHALRLQGQPDTIGFEVLDVTDVVVSKLKRFHANDRSDIEAMVVRGLVSHEELVARFRSAVDAFLLDARAADLPRYVRNLHEVERDLFVVEETEIELPEWI